MIALPEEAEIASRAQSRALLPYGAYSTSGISWLGRFPEHWTVSRLKGTVNGCKNGIWGDDPDGINDLVCVRVADFERTSLRIRLSDHTLRAVGPRHRLGRLLVKGDLLLEKSGGGELQPVGAVMLFDLVLDREAVCSNFVARMRVADGFEPRYLAYLHAALYSARVNTRSIKQTTGIQNLDSDAYLNERVALPPFAEQQAIAAFLDLETARLDALIAKKQRLIELLEEKRAALISRAVTKGLNPDAPKTDSGIDWLGSLPNHWKIPPVYARYSVELGKMLDEKRITGEHLVAYLRNVDVQWDRISVNDLPEMDIRPDEYERYTLKAGDLLVCEGGEVGRTATWAGVVPVCGFQKALHRLRPRSDRDNPRYFFYFMRFAAHAGVFLAGGSPNTIAHLTAEKLRVHRFPSPPPKEQAAIADSLDGECNGINVVSQQVQQAIDKLSEYRAALISAAVTGKIDVRDYQPKPEQEASEAPCP